MLRLADSRNLIVATLDGIGPQNYFPHRMSPPAMPGFADKLSDEQASALVNYLRAALGRPETGCHGCHGARAALSISATRSLSF